MVKLTDKMFSEVLDKLYTNETNRDEASTIEYVMKMREYFRKNYFMGRKHFVAFLGIRNRVFNFKTGSEESKVFLPSKKDIYNEWKKEVNEVSNKKDSIAQQKYKAEYEKNDEAVILYNRMLREVMFEIAELYRREPK